MAKKKALNVKLAPGVSEGHPDDRPGPDIDALSDAFGKLVDWADTGNFTVILAVSEPCEDRIGMPTGKYVTKIVGNRFKAMGMARALTRKLDHNWDYFNDDEDLNGSEEEDEDDE